MKAGYLNGFGPIYQCLFRAEIVLYYKRRFQNGPSNIPRMPVLAGIFGIYDTVMRANVALLMRGQQPSSRLVVFSTLYS